VAARHESAEEGGVDWRRLATDRNVSHAVARALWERARATAPDDLAQAERAFHGMLEEAEAANATHEPGRETLVDATPGARDPSSLGPGKWTRVLLEDQKPGGPAGAARRATENAAQASAERGTENARQPSAEELRGKLVAAEQASKDAAALLAASDPATIIEALRELRDREGPGVIQKIMTVAGSVIERILAPRLHDPQTQTAPVSERVQRSVGDDPVRRRRRRADDEDDASVAPTMEEWRAQVADQALGIEQRVAPAPAAQVGDQATQAAAPATQQVPGSVEAASSASDRDGHDD